MVLKKLIPINHHKVQAECVSGVIEMVKSKIYAIVRIIELSKQII